MAGHALWGCAAAHNGPLDDTRRGDFDIVLGATVTLLSLIIGFSFSMASSRYDQRKNYEEDEANAIGTAYARADLLPSADAVKMHQLFREYLDLRIRSYTTVDSVKVRELDGPPRRSRISFGRRSQPLRRPHLR